MFIIQDSRASLKEYHARSPNQLVVLEYLIDFEVRSLDVFPLVGAFILWTGCVSLVGAL